jgi:hypothetical protein
MAEKRKGKERGKKVLKNNKQILPSLQWDKIRGQAMLK